MIAGLGELQDNTNKRIVLIEKKGCMKGQPDLINNNLHNKYNGFVIEVKTPQNSRLPDDQRHMLEKY